MNREKVIIPTNKKTTTFKNLTNKRTYQPKGKKNYQLWIEQHKEDILKQESKNRVDYVFQNMNKDLNLNMSLKSIYQLLYRNNLIEHKKTTFKQQQDKENENDNIEIIKPKSLIDSIIVNNTNENINEYEKFDKLDLTSQKMIDHISPAIQFTTEHLLPYLTQTSLIMCCLIPNIENVEEEYKPVVNKFIET